MGEIVGMKEVRATTRTGAAVDGIQQGIGQISSGVNKVIAKGGKYLTKPAGFQKFGLTDVVIILISAAWFVFDLMSDVVLSLFLYYEEDTLWWFRLTLIQILVPRIWTNLFSFAWYWQKSSFSSKIIWVIRIPFHILGVGVLYRYGEALWLGYKSREEFKHIQPDDELSYTNRYLRHSNSIALLEMMHAFLQDTPQLVLQLYIMIQRPPEVHVDEDMTRLILVQSGKVLLALLSVSWTIVTYSRTLRTLSPNQKSHSLIASIVIFLWKTFMVAARVLSMALIATIYNIYVFIAVAVHFAAMTFWIVVQRRDMQEETFSKIKFLEEASYDLVMGWVHVFCFVNLTNTPTRKKYAIFYTIMFIENLTAAVVWFLKTKHDMWYTLPSVLGMPGGFIIGISLMLLYYRYLHPESPLPSSEPASFI